MIGATILWPHSIASIPANWHLCDGTQGTPDLRHAFVRGAAIEADVGVGGGVDSQVHNFTSSFHGHALPAAPPSALQAGADYDIITTQVQVTGATDAADNRPVNKMYPWIMRIS